MFVKTYRFQVKNATGVAFGASDSITVKGIRYKIDATGALVQESTEAVLFSGGVSLANGAVENGTSQDNTVGDWFGGDFLLTCVLSTATPNGNVELRYQVSTDGGTTWPDDGTGELIAVINFVATGTKRRGFSL